MWIDPVAFHIGPISVHWYGISYVVGICGAWYIARLWAKRRGADPALWDDLINPIVLGIIVGGRLGHVLFFDPYHYWNHPLEILMVWRGGMSFHGGLLGAAVAMWRYSQYKKVSFWLLADGAAIGTPWALFWGRIANFINGELYGTPTSLSWGVIFPHGGSFPRHPSQLYEACVEGLILTLIMWWCAPRLWGKNGCLSGVLLLGYGAGRFLVEFVREPDWIFLNLTAGQWLCSLMIIGGLWLILRRDSKNLAQAHKLDTATFMRHVLYDPDGYYAKKSIWGKGGDYITSPDISQIFGEMMAVWVVQNWQAMGQGPVRLIELGPGNGTLKDDMNRSFKVFPDFLECLQNQYVVDIDQPIEKIPTSFNGLTFIVSNEFLDALPVYQRLRNGSLRHIIVQDNTLQFESDENVLEECADIEFWVNAFKRLIQSRGRALFIDYGHTSMESHKSTLQAMRGHQYASVFDSIGQCDISSHVNFALWIQHAGGESTLLPQGQWLLEMGARERADQLAMQAPSEDRADIYISLSRLVDPNHMGELFKVWEWVP